jgi:hypothetical protein
MLQAMTLESDIKFKQICAEQSTQATARVLCDSTSERQFTSLCLLFPKLSFLRKVVGLLHITRYDCTTGHCILVGTGTKSPSHVDFDLTIFCS